MNRRYFGAIMFALVTCLPMVALAGGDAAPALRSDTSDGPVKVTARISAASARVAEPIQLVLEVDAPRGARIELPPKAERLGDFEVRHSERTMNIPSAAQSDKRSWIVRSTLESLKTGELTIPPLEVHYTLDASESTFKTISTLPLK